MANLTIHNVDPFNPRMTAAEFKEAIDAMAGDTVETGEEFERLVAVANDPERAMHGFVHLMQRWLGDAPGKRLVWRYKPALGTRRNNSVIEHVVTARFKLMEKDDGDGN